MRRLTDLDTFTLYQKGQDFTQQSESALTLKSDDITKYIIDFDILDRDGSDFCV
jgi:hypothetical protein